MGRYTIGSDTQTAEKVEALKRFQEDFAAHGLRGELDEKGSVLHLPYGYGELSVRIVRHMSKDMYRVFPVFQRDANSYDVNDQHIDSIYLAVGKKNLYIETERRLLGEFREALGRVQEQIEEHKAYENGKETTKKRIEEVLASESTYDTDNKFLEGSESMARPSMRNIHEIRVSSENSVYVELRYLTADGAIKLLEFLKESGIAAIRDA